MIQNKRPTLLCVLDGLGLNPNPKANAVALARKPTLDRLFRTCSNSTLITHGTRVGLPEGHMGNSEVGHLNIGAGRVVEQWLYRITRELESGLLKKSSVFDKFIQTCTKDGVVHLIGLFSYGGVHSSAPHMYKIVDELLARGKQVVLHPILDGRDTAPTIAEKDLRELLSFVNNNPSCRIGSISGRYYAMDRDKRWDRTELAWRTIMNSEGPSTQDPIQYIRDSYEKGVTDEFIIPATVNPSPIRSSDSVIFFNFRADRMRQIVAAITDSNFTGFSRTGALVSSTRTLCLTEYDSNFKLPYLFEAIPITNHLGEVVKSCELKQLRVAETEKYPHVTYFFNGLDESPLRNEERSLIPSPRDVKTYDLKPEMSAFGVRDTVLKAIESELYDLIVVNFANCDMVGHTGILNAAIKAVETVDSCLGSILEALDNVGGQALIIADHGNAEQMVDYETGVPHTSHTTYPVPVILYGRKEKIRSSGALCDVAPTILQMMGLSQPREMTGKSLLGN